MKWLLWKEYRHNRLIVFTALVLALLPHLITLGVVCWAAAYWPPGTVKLEYSFVMACFYSIGLSGIGLALISGNAIAGERVDRSAEFLFILPIPRRNLFASKLLMILTVAIIPWLFNLTLLWCLTRTPSLWLYHDMDISDVRSFFIFIPIGELLCFGVSWFLSSLIASTSFATLAGLLSSYIVLLVLVLIVAILELPHDDAFLRFWWVTTCLTLAPVCFAIGTWHYLRRVEP